MMYTEYSYLLLKQLGSKVTYILFITRLNSDIDILYFIINRHSDVLMISFINWYILFIIITISYFYYQNCWLREELTSCMFTFSWVAVTQVQGIWGHNSHDFPWNVSGIAKEQMRGSMPVSCEWFNGDRKQGDLLLLVVKCSCHWQLLLFCEKIVLFDNLNVGNNLRSPHIPPLSILT